MKNNYVLIDYENVQPKEFELLKTGPFQIKIFLGPNQVKIPVSLAACLQPFGANVEYLLLETSGGNALDFLIAYKIGVLSGQDPNGFFHVISKDTGFDPLIKYLKARGILVHRSESIADMPCFKPKAPTGNEAQIETAIAHLIRMKAAKPRKKNTLLSSLNTIFKKELSEPQLSSVFAGLCKRGVVKLEGEKILYDLKEVD